MSKFKKNSESDQYGAGLFEQQKFGTALVEGVSVNVNVVAVHLGLCALCDVGQNHRHYLLPKTAVICLKQDVYFRAKYAKVHATNSCRVTGSVFTRRC